MYSRYIVLSQEERFDVDDIEISEIVQEVAKGELRRFVRLTLPKSETSELIPESRPAAHRSVCF
jgi:hypothetical protein